VIAGTARGSLYHRAVRPLLATLLPIVLLGCAGPAPQPAPQAAATAPSALPAPPTPVEPPSARVAAVAPSRESVPYTKAKILFTNPTKRACRFVSYKLTWGAAHKDIKLDAFSVPAGETRERWLRVNPDEGDLAALTVEGARVEVQVDCSGG